VSYLDDVGHELVRLHIPAARRRRILGELDDHLRCDPTAVERLGHPALLAGRFADELGTAFARRAAVTLFAALAPFGLLFGVLFALLGVAGFTTSDPNFVGPAVIVGVQIAFVGGSLALLRTWRLRHERTVTAAQAAVVRRRTAFGLAGGALTLIGIVTGASNTAPHVAAWFEPLAFAIAAVGAVTLSAAAIVLVSAYRLRPSLPGPAAGDLESDLGPFVPTPLRGSPWRLALAIAGLVALCIAIAGVVQADPFDGVARALADAAACLAGFAVLGRPLGLRS